MACRAERPHRGALRWLAAPLLLLGAATSSAKIFPFQSDWDDLSNKYAPQFAPIKSSSSEVEVALAKHLTPPDTNVTGLFALRTRLARVLEITSTLAAVRADV